MPATDITAPPLDPEQLADRLRRAPWRRYVAIGDSLTEGLGDPVEGYPHMSWTDSIARAFKRLHPDFEYLNLGERYLTARQVRETQLEAALAFAPDLATVVAGGNDLGDPFDPDGIERELDAMLSALTEAGATVVTLSMLDVTRSPRYAKEVAEFLGPRIATHREIARRVAERHDAVFVDGFGHALCEDPTVVSDDLQHPNMRGYAIIADLVLQGLASLVASSRP
jgi:lysophospholipase L1-like esterase